MKTRGREERRGDREREREREGGRVGERTNIEQAPCASEGQVWCISVFIKSFLYSSITAVIIKQR
jgi:hypothetical protein